MFDSAIQTQNHAQNGSWPTILLAGDDAMRQSLAQSLRLDGYLVLEARNEEEAHRIVIMHSRTIHVLLVVFPHGFDLLRKLSPYRPEMQTVFYTGNTNSALAQVRKTVKPPARGVTLQFAARTKVLNVAKAG